MISPGSPPVGNARKAGAALWGSGWKRNYSGSPVHHLFVPPSHHLTAAPQILPQPQERSLASLRIQTHQLKYMAASRCPGNGNAKGACLSCHILLLRDALLCCRRADKNI